MGKFRSHIGMWLARGILGITFILCTILTLSPSGRTVAHSAQLLASVINASSDTNTHDRPDVRHISTTLLTAYGPVYTDLITPREDPPVIPGSREAVILIAGVGDNRTVPQLINLEDSFAESGIDVMAITTPALINYTLFPDDANGVVAAFQKLMLEPDVNPHAIGIIGLSAGSGLACLAAADARIRNQVAFITLFGGYFNVADLIVATGERALHFDGKSEAWDPQLVPLQVLANSVAPDLPPDEASALQSAFNPDFSPISPIVLATYSPTTQAIYHLLAGDEPHQAKANLAQLPASIQTLLASLSPQTVLPDIRAKIFLLHDRHDQFVPFTESRHFAAALQAQKLPFQYVEFNIFQHVEIKGDLPIGELLGDGSHLFELLNAIVYYGQ